METAAQLKELTILYLEDEDIIRNNISKVLEYMFHRVYSVECVDDALEIYHQNKIDIILSDISMPEKNGIDFVKIIRQEDTTIPIILLTAHTDTHYLLDATKLKLVDYLTKPINFDELQQALIKAGQEWMQSHERIIHFNNNFQYSFQKKQLIQNNTVIELTPKEILLLEFLYAHKNKTISKQEIQEHIWEDTYQATESAFKSLLNKLRKKIGKESITNSSGVGYRLEVISL